MNQYFLGVDFGNTKSHAIIADESGRAQGFGLAGPGSWEAVGWSGAYDVLHDITNQALVAAGIEKCQIQGAGFGFAGYDWPEDRPPHIELIESLGLGAPFQLVNDAAIGLFAGASDGWGVVVAAGTSCNSYGRDPQGREGRAAGFGLRYGENAGASELMGKAVQAIAKAWARRGPATRITDAFVEVTGASDVFDLLAGLTRERYYLSAADAPLVFAVAEDGDEVAQSIIQWAGRELGYLANGVIRQLDVEGLAFDTVLSGSFFNGSPAIQEAMAEAIKPVAPEARLIRLNAPPVIGGVLLGMEQAGLTDTESARLNLIKTASALLQDLKPISVKE